MEREIDLNDRLRWIRELSCNSKRKERMIKELMENYKLYSREDKDDKSEDRNVKIKGEWVKLK